MTAIRSVTVYAASSRRVDRVYLDAARDLGRHLAEQGVRIVFGGGRVGLMGALADAALAAGGEVLGVLPRFMHAIEWGHEELTELRVVGSMHERKHTMVREGDAFVALPGGCGTLEELLEVITWKRLALHGKPIAILDVNGYYQPLVAMLEQSIAEGFMDPRHAGMWAVVDSVDALLPALAALPPWDASMRDVARP